MADGTAPMIPDLVWKNTNSEEQNDPVAYVGGSGMNVTVKFAVSPPMPVSIGNIKIEGEISGLGRFRKTGITVPAGVSTLTVSDISTDPSTVLPSATTFYNPMVIDWRHMWNWHGLPNSVFDGASGHRVYVTLAPLADPNRPVFLTSLHLAVATPESAIDSNTATMNAWKKFETQNVKSWDDRPLFYYGVGASNRTTAPKSAFCPNNELPLLSNPSQSGECTCFMQLFLSALNINGISADEVSVSRTNPADDTFLVKEWTFFGPPTYTLTPPYEWRLSLNQVAVAENDIMFPPFGAMGTLWGDLQNQTTIRGQNTAPPAEKAFSSHAMVKRTNITQGGVPVGPYFDPSYGKTFSGAADFETNGIDGYTRVSLSPTGLFELRVREKTPGSPGVSLVP